MLGIWFGMALVNISGYQPIAEQTWVQLRPDDYPLHRTPPAIFVAWRGNQLPPLARKKLQGHWQILFPARLVPPFALYEGEAQLSKAYLARLARIDQLACGQVSCSQSPAPRAPAAPAIAVAHPVMAEFSLPVPAMTAAAYQHGAMPWLARSPLSSSPPRAQPQDQTALLILPAPAAGGARRLCHQVVAGETLWRIASQLLQQEGTALAGMDTYGYLLALAADNRAQMGRRGDQVRAGTQLYCPQAETLARFAALTLAERQQQLARLAQGD